jgi:hypothetical protein
VEFELIKDGDGPVSMGDGFFREARVRSQEMQDRDPIVGDMVHFWDGSACRAAVVTQDDLDTVCLTAYMPDGPDPLVRHADVEHDEAKCEDTWHWPEMGQ